MRRRRIVPTVVLVGVVLGLIIGLPRMHERALHVPLALLALLDAALLARAVGRHRTARPVWLRFFAAALCLCVHYGMFLTPSNGDGLFGQVRSAVILGAAVGAALLAGWAVLVLTRPLLSHAATRRGVLIAVPLGLIGATGIALADPVVFPGGRGVFGTVALGFTVVAAVVSGLTIAVTVRPLVAVGRTVERYAALSSTALLVLSVVSVVNYTRWWPVAPMVSMAIVVAASISPSAAHAGTPLDARPVITNVSYRWAFVSAVPIAATTPLAELGAPSSYPAVAVVLSLTAYALFLRDLRGGTPAPTDRPTDRMLAIARALPAALVRGRLDLHYQPIVRLADGVIVGFEALQRWDHPDLGPVRQQELVAAARWAGLGTALEGHVVEEVSRQVPIARAALDGQAPYLAVNVSPASLQRDGFARDLLARLASTGGTVEGLVVEIVEQGEIRDWGALRENVAVLQRAGARIGLDDFGTGTSNLQYLSEIDADLVKLDRALVRWAAAGPGRHVVQSVVDLVHASGLPVVAEGIEDDLQLTMLRELGVDLVQSFHTGPPAPLTVALARAGRGPVRAVVDGGRSQVIDDGSEVSPRSS